MTEPHSPILDHYESFFGEMLRGFLGSLRGVSAVELRDGDVTLVGTVGLSLYPRKSPISDQVLRQELLMMWRGDANAREVAAVLLGLCVRVVTVAPLLRGEVLDLGSPIHAGSRFSHVVATVPAFLPEGFALCETPQGVCVFCWLMPLSAAEVAFVRQRGWPELEDRLEGATSGLLDVSRADVVE